VSELDPALLAWRALMRLPSGAAAHESPQEGGGLMVFAFTTNGDRLIQQLLAKLKDGSIATWEGRYLKGKVLALTHLPGQYADCAYFRPQFREHGVRFDYLPGTKNRCPTDTFAVYHGRFSELIIQHCNGLFANIGLYP
jgi:hypothetical protein